MNLFRKEGHISFRSAGSHSPIDVVDIDHEFKIIKFIQCKPDSMSDKEKERIRKTLPKDDFYAVFFSVE